MATAWTTAALVWAAIRAAGRYPASPRRRSNGNERRTAANTTKPVMRVIELSPAVIRVRLWPSTITVAPVARSLFRRVSWARSWQVSFPIGATSVRKTVGAAGFEPAILTLSHAYLSLPSGHCHSSAATAGGSHLAPSPHSNCWLAASLAAVEISCRLRIVLSAARDNRVPCVTACDIRARMALGSAGVAVLPAGSLIPRAGGGGDD